MGKKLRIMIFIVLILLAFSIFYLVSKYSIGDICSNLNKEDKAICYIDLALSNQNQNFCEKINNLTIEKECIYQCESLSLDPKVQPSFDKEKCINGCSIHSEESIIAKCKTETNKKRVILNNRSKQYEDTLAKINKCNNYFIFWDMSDACFEWQYYHRGCYYDTSNLKEQSGCGSVENIQKITNLTHEEKRNLCNLFSHKAMIAYCLKVTAVDNEEKQECLNFAGDNEYLIRICQLNEGETLDRTGTYTFRYSELEDNSN